MVGWVKSSWLTLKKECQPLSCRKAYTLDRGLVEGGVQFI